MNIATPTGRILALLLLCAPFTLFAQSQGATIESIDIQGNRRLSDDDISKMISTRVGQTLNEEQLQKDLRAILASGQFDKADTRVRTEPDSTGQAVVIFEVHELPLIAKLELDGLKYVSRQEVEEYLATQMPVMKAGVPYSPGDARRYRQLIRTYFLRRGFEQVTVTCVEEEVSGTSVSVKFQIDEMPGDDEGN